MFNNSGSCYSLADIAAATGGYGNNGGFGGDGDGWWIILLFLFALGGWGNGNGWGNGGGGSTREEIAYGFDMNGIENGIRGIQQGLCDGFYSVNTDMMNGFAGVQSALCQGFSGINQGMTTNTNSLMQAINADTIANMQNTNAISAGITALGTQMAQCCCDSRYESAKGFADLNYNIATTACNTQRAIADSTRDIMASQEAGVRSILDFLTQDKIASLQAENQALKFATSQQAQNAYLVSALKDPCPVPAYVVPNPNCCYGVNTVNTCGNSCLF